MLVLDETKIRSGKPVSLPYQGSKGKICKQIVEIIKQNFGTDKTVYDIFGGGGAITYECILNGLNVVYNDFNTYITEVHKNLRTYPKEKIIDLMISRDEFHRIKQLHEKTWLDEFKLLLNSFGNKRNTYMYNKVYSDFKYELALKIWEKYGFEDYKKTDLFLNAEKEFNKKYRLKDESRFGCNQIEIIGRLNRVYSVIDKNVNFSIKNEDYRYFSDVENSILYLDPPPMKTRQLEDMKELVILIPKRFMIGLMKCQRKMWLSFPVTLFRTIGLMSFIDLIKQEAPLALMVLVNVKNFSWSQNCKNVF